ncbi:MAG TPA: hypothetical protein VFC78_24600 [Tepidisphaeraceae bacterium]|nr:hypothetical protein [Tepidisphaeraceae bacterium]
MNLERTNRILLMAATAAISTLAFSRPASAQYPANQDGHANDANNRVGSGGINTRGNIPTGVTSNDIVYGNVTGGRGFSGPVRSGDPGAFRHLVPGAGIDNFVKNSSGSPIGAAPADLNTPQPYYGTSRFAPPPAGALPEGFNGGYVGGAMQSPSSFAASLNNGQLGGLQSRTDSRDELLLNANVNPYGYPGVAGYNQAGVSASPLFGIRQVQAGQLNSLSPGIELPDGLGGDQSVLRMRQEMLDAAQGIIAPGNRLNPNSPQKTGDNKNQPTDLDGGPDAQLPTGTNPRLNHPLPSPVEAPADARLNNRIQSQVGNSRIDASGALPRAAAPDGLLAADRQSTLIDSLENRLKRYQADTGTAPTPSRAPQPNRKANGFAALTPGVGEPGIPEGPQKVSSLATGIKARGLHDLLSGAEEMMRQGKYSAAIDRFNQAQRVVPNNPLAPLGRAHAELAAGYYAHAEQDLRSVWRRDPEMLMAQFDLPGVISAQRMQFLRKDLLALAKTDPKAERPWFLLAYLDYNSGDAAAAEKDLNEASKRAGRADWAIRLLKAHWALPSKKNEEPGAKPGAGTGRNIVPVRGQTPVGAGAPASAQDLNK